MSTPIQCPICAGTGLVSRPPWIAGDIESYTTSTTGPYPCNACGGQGYIMSPPPIPFIGKIPTAADYNDGRLPDGTQARKDNPK